jgi:Family of unknown function (DUF5681)
VTFRKGQSGNPAGRKKGAATRIVAELQQVVSADAKEIVKLIVAQAKAGDTESRRAFLKLLPQGKWPTPFTLPKIGPSDLPPAAQAAIEAAAKGDLSLEDAERVMGLINDLRQAFEATTLAAQLDEMRKQLEELNARANP